MTTKRIALSPSRDIPFNRLVLSQSNVRRIKTGVSIDELAEDIANRGLLQSLNVRAVKDSEGNETGLFEIPAGGRRYRALEVLVKQKRLAKNAPVPCVVREGGRAEEDSLVENLQRTALHPLDQFRAFQSLRETGLSEEDIAARFFVPVNIVKQRLKLASVSPKLLDIYADDAITLEQLMAFSISNDHQRQEQVWEQIQNSWSKEPFVIRRMLTEKSVRVGERRVQFVGIEAFKAAGGIVMRDLFSEDSGGWIEDVALLDRLVAEKLAAAAIEVAAEGWQWTETAVDFPYGNTHGLEQLASAYTALSDEEASALAALKDEQDRLEAVYAKSDELPEDVDERLGEIETAIALIEDKPKVFDPDAVRTAGAFISIAADGALHVERGYVRSVASEAGEDDPGILETGQGREGAVAVAVEGQGPSQSDENEDEAVRPLPDRLVTELTAHRTLALRNAIASNPTVALTVLLHKLCLDLFNRQGRSNCLEASVRPVHLDLQPSELKRSATSQAVAARHGSWKASMPQTEDALWAWLTDLGDENRLSLLAHCVSFGINALHEKPNPYASGMRLGDVAHRLAGADRVSRAVGLDMAEVGWKPTVDNYLGRVTKPRIIEAVREARGEHAALLIEHLKKPEMAREAERLLDGSGWLPEPLRLADPGDAPEGSSADLPEFLEEEEDGGEPTEEADPDQRFAVAAE